MTIIGQKAGVPDAGMQLLHDIAKACNDQENKKNEETIAAKKKRRTCQKLGQDKHACCDEKIKEHQEKTGDKDNPNGKPPVKGEQCFKRPPPVDKTPVALNRSQAIQDAIKSAGPGATRDQIGAAIGAKLNGLVFPDASVIDANGKETFVDFKFACPASNRSKKKSTVKNYRPPGQSPRQHAAHSALGTGSSPTILF